MSIPLTLAIFFVVWWITFLAVLPFGIKSPEQAGERMVPGQASGAPATPAFARKIIWTTVIASLITAIAWANAHFGWIGFADLPGPNKYY